MYSQNKVSIIVPAYNAGKYIGECIDSILCQSYKNFELIIIDDGSTDDTSSICDEYSAIDERIIVKHKKNEGANYARRDGVEAANGEFVMFVDSDDVIDKLTISNLMAHVHENIEIVAGEADKDISMTVEEYGQWLLSWNSVHLWGKLFKRELFDSWVFNIPREITVAEDFIINLRCLKKAKGEIIVCSQRNYYYRQQKSSIIHQFKPSPEYEMSLVLIVRDSINCIPYNLEYGSIVYQIGVLEHLICWHYKSDRVWLQELIELSLKYNLTLKQKLVVNAAGDSNLAFILRIINPFQRIYKRIKRVIRWHNGL